MIVRGCEFRRFALSGLNQKLDERTVDMPLPGTPAFGSVSDLRRSPGLFGKTVRCGNDRVACQSCLQ